MEILIFVILLGLIPATIAKSKGYSFAGFWIYGALLFLVALPHALIMEPYRQGQEGKAISEGRKKCRHCAEIIRGEAIVCQSCGLKPSKDTGWPNSTARFVAQG